MLLKITIFLMQKLASLIQQPICNIHHNSKQTHTKCVGISGEVSVSHKPGSRHSQTLRMRKSRRPEEEPGLGCVERHRFQRVRGCRQSERDANLDDRQNGTRYQHYRLCRYVHVCMEDETIF